MGDIVTVVGADHSQLENVGDMGDIVTVVSADHGHISAWAGAEVVHNAKKPADEAFGSWIRSCTR